MDTQKLNRLIKQYLKLSRQDESDVSVFFERTGIESQYAAYVAIRSMYRSLQSGAATLMNRWHQIFDVAQTSNVDDPIDAFCYRHDLICNALTTNDITYQPIDRTFLLGNGLKYGFKTELVEGPVEWNKNTGDKYQSVQKLAFFYAPHTKNGLVKYVREDGIPGAYLLLEYLKNNDNACMQAIFECGLKPHTLDIVESLWCKNYNTKHKELYDRAGIVRLYAGLHNYSMTLEDSIKLSTLMDSLKLPLSYIDSLEHTQTITAEKLPELDIDFNV